MEASPLAQVVTESGVAAWVGALAHQKSFIVLFLAALAFTAFGMPVFLRVAVRQGWLDHPGGRKAHAAPVPTLGGLTVFAAVYCGVAVTLAWGNRVSEMLWEHGRYVFGALVCTAAMIGVGAWDDLRGLRVQYKFLAQSVVAVAAFVLGFRIEQVTLPGLGSAALGGASFAATIIWIVAITNAVNFSDGLDGLAAGVGFLAAAVNAGVAIWLGNYYMAVMMLLLAGALLGFLRWNFPPARVFLGDAGSQGLGMFLALCSLHSAQKSHTVVMILAPIAALGYPIFDLLLAVTRRVLRGQPVWASDRDHIHHRLVARGHTASQATLMIYVASLAVVAVCLAAIGSNHPAVGLVLAGVAVVGVVCMRVLGYVEWGGWESRAKTQLLHAAFQLARLKMQRAATREAQCEALAVLARELNLTAFEVRQGDLTIAWRAGTAEAGTAAFEPLPPADGSGWRVRPAAALDDPARRALWEELVRGLPEGSWPLPGEGAPP